jgi:hypothetical protein
VSREGGRAPLEQRCIEPGHWYIEGRHVRAVYQGRSRNVLAWDIDVFPGETPPGRISTLSQARDWIRDQKGE